jgi:hypothetical protein
MKFGSLFDYKYFLKGVEDTLIDGALKNRLKSAHDYEILDTDYFLLKDSVSSYMGELKHYSKNKTFFRNLLVDELTDAHIPDLFALLTHTSIGLCDRRKVRSGVNTEPFFEIKEKVETMVSDILSKGSIENNLKEMLK